MKKITKRSDEKALYPFIEGKDAYPFS